MTELTSIRAHDRTSLYDEHRPSAVKAVQACATTTDSGTTHGATSKDERGPWSFQVLTSVSHMRAHGKEWMELERDSIDPHAAFQSFVWCEHWAARFCKDDGTTLPHIVMVRQGERLMAVLPLMVCSKWGIRSLVTFGEPHTQIASAIVRAGQDCREGLRLSLEHAVRTSGVDLVSIGPIPDYCTLAQALGKEAQSADNEPLHNGTLVPDPAQYLSLVEWPGMRRSEDYIKSLSKNRRKDFSRKDRRTREAGELRYEIVTPDDGAFQELVTLALNHKQAWLETHGIVSNGLSREGHTEFLAGMERSEGRFFPELELLTLNGTPFAFNFNLVGHGYRQCYLSAYDEAYLEFSPGTLLDQISVRQAIDDQLVGMNLLGFPTPFKDQWSTNTIDLLRFQQCLTWRGFLLQRVWTNTIRPLCKSAFMGLRSIKTWPVVGPFLARRFARLSAEKSSDLE